MKDQTGEKYILTVGLEIHAELATRSKMWCGCKNDPDEDRPNVNICPICMAHPGTLPVINREAVRKVIQVGTALGGKIAYEFTEFDRKNYFYPDIPKGYQLSQYKFPLVSGGELKGVKLTRIHIEEDTGTSIHDQGEYSLVNYNRAGVPLMELVTEPVIHDAATASAFAKEFQLLLQYLGAGEANLEKGEMRVEANISVSKKLEVGSGKLGTKVEVKNLNSFKAVEKAIEYEMKRHIALLDKGEEIKQETRGWDENKSATFSQRSKENAHDYRYFLDPDLPKLKLSEIAEFSESEIRKTLPELPWQKRARYVGLGLSEQHAEFFVSDLKAAKYFDSIISHFAADPASIKTASNYIAVDLAGLSQKDDFEVFPEADQIVGLVALIKSNKLSSRGAKDVLLYLTKKESQGKSAEEIANEKGLLQVSDEKALEEIVNKIITDNPTVVTDYKSGKTPLLQFLIGQCMKASKGAGNPETFKKILLQILG